MRVAQTNRLSKQWRWGLVCKAHCVALIALVSLDSPAASSAGQSIKAVAFPAAIDRPFSLAGTCLIHIVTKEEWEARVSHSRPSSLSNLLHPLTLLAIASLLQPGASDSQSQ